MEDILKIARGSKTIVLLGEAGSGKTEVALNLSYFLATLGKVDFFDMDQTKPLFRSRDFEEYLSSRGISVHYKTQYMDTPMAVGGVIDSINNEDIFTVLDVGGNDTGARLIGQYSSYLKNANARIIYLINPYRPWSNNINSIDRTLSEILFVSHLDFNMVSIWANPNIGVDTTPEDVLRGIEMSKDMLDAYVTIEGVFVKEDFYDEIREKTQLPCISIHQHIDYVLNKGGKIGNSIY